jgi:hypothetical protein
VSGPSTPQLRLTIDHAGIACFGELQRSAAGPKVAPYQGFPGPSGTMIDDLGRIVLKL